MRRWQEEEEEACSHLELQDWIFDARRFVQRDQYEGRQIHRLVDCIRPCSLQPIRNIYEDQHSETLTGSATQ